MQIRYFAWFETKHEKTEFIKLLNSCRSDIEAVNKVSERYPELPYSKVQGVVDNYKKEIGKQ